MNHFYTHRFFIKTLFLLALALLSYLFLDRTALLFVEKRSVPLSKIFSLLIFPPLHLALWTALFLWARFKKSRWTLPLFCLAGSQCLCAFFARVLKVLAGRARPDLFLSKGIYGFHGFSFSHHYHSFPSGHALTAFALATSCSLLFPRGRVLFYLLASVCSLSRLFLLDHYCSDLIVAAVAGILIAAFVHTTIVNIYYKKA